MDSLDKQPRVGGNMIVLLVIVGVILLVAAMILLKGWVLQHLWSWFITPLGLPELGLAHAIGIAMTVGFLTHQIIPEKPHEEKHKDLERVGFQFIGALLVFVIGWIVHRFMY